MVRQLAPSRQTRRINILLTCILGLNLTASMCTACLACRPGLLGEESLLPGRHACQVTAAEALCSPPITLKCATPRLSPKSKPLNPNPSGELTLELWLGSGCVCGSGMWPEPRLPTHPARSTSHSGLPPGIPLLRMVVSLFTMPVHLVVQEHCVA